MEDLDPLLADGWQMTLADAIAGKPAKKSEPEDDEPITRAELEQQATELGIKFDGRTTDAALIRKIAEELEK